ncbi:phage antirepressor KilAC domain-containing protein [Melissococcus plutonius]|uniref:phage antirepressor KilAC domain-containing protein n=2 Tax=Melissococcus plutonius TaxID=33970 RepID=UPI003C3089AD
MNTPQIFNFEQNEVRTVEISGEPYFVGKDVAEILGYSNTRDALAKRVDSEDKYGVAICDSIGREQKITAINESGLYSLILSSKMPNAKKFKRWVTNEVLPSIRKSGMYMTDAKAYDVVTNPDSLADLLQQASDQLKQKDLTIQELKPKALFADAVRGSKNSCLVKDLSVLLKQNGVEIGQNRLFDWLRDNGYLGKGNGHKNKPTQRSMEQGLFEYREHFHTDSNGEIQVRFTPLITGKGQEYFVNKFCKQTA